MLDKIAQIQHSMAGRTDSSKPSAPVPAALQLDQPLMEKAVKNLAADSGTEAGGFYGLDGEDVVDTVAVGNTFPAVIPEAQVLVAGATVALRLLQQARIGGVEVPRDELLYGKAAISGDRLLVTINSVRVGGSVYPVTLQVYDLDGLAGIHVPGAITRDALKQSAAEGVSGLGVVATDPSLRAQAATAGIEAARSLLSRKIALVRVTVPAGYRVLLKNQKSENR
jgi:conjugative transposon TraM protein